MHLKMWMPEAGASSWRKEKIISKMTVNKPDCTSQWSEQSCEV